jgi:uncharacterized integral membrane protein
MGNSYLDISYIDTSVDVSFVDDSEFNKNQYIFYNQVNDSLNELNKPIEEKIKQIQINTYYYKKYKSENNLLYFIIIIILIIIILSFINKLFPFLDTYYSIIVGIIISFSLLYIIYSIWIMINKDNTNYDEHQYGFDSTINHDANEVTAAKYNHCIDKQSKNDYDPHDKHTSPMDLLYKNLK